MGSARIWLVGRVPGQETTLPQSWQMHHTDASWALCRGTAGRDGPGPRLAAASRGPLQEHSGGGTTLCCTVVAHVRWDRVPGLWSPAIKSALIPWEIVTLASVSKEMGLIPNHDFSYLPPLEGDREIQSQTDPIVSMSSAWQRYWYSVWTYLPCCRALIFPGEVNSPWATLSQKCC